MVQQQYHDWQLYTERPAGLPTIALEGARLTCESEPDAMSHQSIQVYNSLNRNLDHSTNAPSENWCLMPDLVMSFDPLAVEFPAVLEAPMELAKANNIISQPWMDDISCIQGNAGVTSSVKAECDTTFTHDTWRFVQQSVFSPMGHPLVNSSDFPSPSSHTFGHRLVVNGSDIEESMKTVELVAGQGDATCPPKPSSHAGVGPQQFQVIVPRRPKTVRKKGRACLSCGQAKIKVRQKHKNIISLPEQVSS